MEQGATFFIELPIIATSPTPEKKPELLVKEAAVPVQTRLLIVDDEKSVLDVLSLALKRKGFVVDTANNGREALERLKNIPYNLIVSDIRMPELDGAEFYRQVLKKDAELAQHVIFTSGDLLNPDTRRFIEETGLPLLSKPFELEELIARITAILPREVSNPNPG